LQELQKLRTGLIRDCQFWKLDRSLFANERKIMSWTDDRVALLSKLWADGLSASQIAAELGGVTRNAVIGKVHRLGLSGRAKPANSSIKRPKRASNKGYGKSKSSPRSGNKGMSLSVVTRTVIEDIPEPESLKMNLVDLTECTCRWPSGDPATSDFHFCGHKTKEDSPYCEYHSRLAYQPTTDRRRERKTGTR